MRIGTVTAIALALAALGGAPAAHATAIFMGLGSLPGASSSSAAAVSSDGSFVVGASGGEAFRWSAADGMVGLGRPPGAESTAAADVSDDGSVVVGTTTTGTSPATRTTEAFRWTAADGIVGLGSLLSDSRAAAVSGDGTVVVGASRSPLALPTENYPFEAFRWTASEGMVGLGFCCHSPPYLYNTWTFAHAVSDDGSVIVGTEWSHEEDSSVASARRWVDGVFDPADGLRLGNSFGNAVSSDGSFVVGQVDNGSVSSGTPNYPDEAFLWSESGGGVRLGFLHPRHPDDEPPFDSRTSSAVAISDDGLVVGSSCRDDLGCEPFVWSSSDGMRALQEVLEEDYGLDLTGWTDLSVADISADGLTIVGNGSNPSGAREAWIAFIPEPGIAPLLALGLVGLSTRPRVRLVGRLGLEPRTNLLRSRPILSNDGRLRPSGDVHE
jgi:probable HAF family extracellular repeat protein